MGHQSASPGSNVSPYQHIGHEITFDWRDYVSFDHGFNDNGTPIPETASTDEVRREASARSDRIWVNFETLHRILQRHEAKIRKRWYKKNTAQRLAILLDAWPDMPEVHRPDFAAFREMTDESRDSGLRHKSCFVWPYINQEDLRSEKVLPLLLNSRGRHPSSQFAAANYEAMRLRLVVHGFEAVHVQTYHGLEWYDRELSRLW
ncbi:hypothetical protein N8T08_001403 [Aspergillus melleus]|uniref:Uncharacterized protein n=1 Tax=Aspergillus melleus TaxID=138277 RepID=A0ACC3BAB5_9EURO|nr:hypothetical protein N8T08_001403 [Aspergillus melleus]